MLANLICYFKMEKKKKDGGAGGGWGPEPLEPPPPQVWPRNAKKPTNQPTNQPTDKHHLLGFDIGVRPHNKHLACGDVDHPHPCHLQPTHRGCGLNCVVDVS